ncbi:integral membrane sensor signal transduction histidine kinase [Candidatus Scalindua japonica]|uniref:histidine kinase n=1 Tax=Candidatus Scalindua japonica TaxID=1284222 RepID=A0A286TVC8_9BACT|nr:HAMP domain-containing sensor histidine kinase [Candidatus Scalindua japonica]GAX59843.1 integral membrane sensor signal transduction histidine kinase [Candidatus Scalindua japonica]
MPHNIHSPEKSSQEKELVESLSRFINLRWIMAVMICITSVFARFILNIKLPLTSILTITFCIMMFTFVCFYFQKQVKSYERFANIQISVDWIALISLVHFTGGIESPVIFYFIFHVIIASILLSKKECYLQTGFAVLLIISLSILEYFHILPHIHIKELFPVPVYNNGLYLLSVIFFSITSLYISAYLATSVNKRLRKRENEIIFLKDSITDAYNKLELVDREKSEFTYKVTHELRSPLSAIQSLLKSIEEGYAGEVPQKARELIARSEKRTGFLLTLVNDLLDLVSGKREKPSEKEIGPVDVNESLQGTLHLMQEKSKNKGIEISINSDLKPSYLNVDRDDLDIIMTNLIDNAIKYTERGGKINIDSRMTGKEIIVTISDTGIGIPEEDLDKIFDEFYRAENAKDIEHDGTGLGLPIVNSLVKRYGGDIDAQSTLEKGTTFTVSFSVNDQH